MVKGKQLYCSEYSQGDHTWFLLENEDAECGVICHMELKVDGYQLEEPTEEPNKWSIEIEAGSRQLRHLIPVQKDAKKPGAGRGMMGGFNPMAALIDDYEAAARSFSYKVGVEWQDPEVEEY